MTRLDLIASMAPRSGAEVGTLRGDFAADLLTIPTLETLYIIDAWTHFPGDYERDPANVDQGGQDERERFVRERFRGDPRAIIHKGLSRDAAACLVKTPIDFAFLDAAHTYAAVSADLLAWSKVARVMLVHDYLDTEATRKMGFGVKLAVRFFCEFSGWRVDFVTDEEWPTARLIRP